MGKNITTCRPPKSFSQKPVSQKPVNVRTETNVNVYGSNVNSDDISRLGENIKSGLYNIGYSIDNVSSSIDGFTNITEQLKLLETINNQYTEFAKYLVALNQANEADDGYYPSDVGTISRVRQAIHTILLSRADEVQNLAKILFSFDNLLYKEPVEVDGIGIVDYIESIIDSIAYVNIILPFLNGELYQDEYKAIEDKLLKAGVAHIHMDNTFPRLPHVIVQSIVQALVKTLISGGPREYYVDNEPKIKLVLKLNLESVRY